MMNTPEYLTSHWHKPLIACCSTVNTWWFQYWLACLLCVTLISVPMLTLALENNISQSMDKPLTLSRLLATLPQIDSIRMAYTETRYSVFFKNSVSTKGEIEYHAQAQFSKTVRSGGHQKFSINGQTLTIQTYTGDNTPADLKTIELDNYPQFKPFFLLFTGLLQGNTNYLSQWYDHEITVLNDQQIRLLLTPQKRNPFIENPVPVTQSIEVIFTAGLITELNSSGFGGERSELRITSVLDKQLKSN
jgi:hypothetical protein